MFSSAVTISALHFTILSGLPVAEAVAGYFVGV
jgi:hypothetical protein